MPNQRYLMITCDGDKFVVARWLFDYELGDIRDYLSSYTDESLIKCSNICVLRNQEDFNKLGNKVMEELQQFYEEMLEGSDVPEPVVWSWHIPDPRDKPVPERMILFRGETEVCSVWFEQVDPLD
jgi:hypothetical protein